MTGRWALTLAAALAAGLVAGCGGGGGGGGTPSGELPVADPGSSIIVDNAEAEANQDLLPSTWLTQGHLQKVVFGHQSVGGNILDGLSALASATPAKYAVDMVDAPTELPNGGIAQFAVGDNGDPAGKIADYNTKMRTWLGGGSAYTASMMKLCFVDFDDTTDVTTLFNTYRDTMAQLEADYPAHRFIYTTAPLMTDYSATRAQYNDLVRNYCSTNNKALFDIAAIESHDPSGNAVGGDQPRMYSAYSSDGGHLNSTGARRVARAYWWLMARVAGWDGT